jgi:hypothetical protein
MQAKPVMPAESGFSEDQFVEDEFPEEGALVEEIPEEESIEEQTTKQARAAALKAPLGETEPRAFLEHRAKIESPRHTPKIRH